jgi:Primase zinc finger
MLNPKPFAADMANRGRGARVQDGNPCTMPVNVATCAFCEFHMAAEYRRLQSTRGAFADSMLTTGLRKPKRAAGAPKPGAGKAKPAKLALWDDRQLEEVAASKCGTMLGPGCRCGVRESQGLRLLRLRRGCGHVAAGWGLLLVLLSGGRESGSTLWFQSPCSSCHPIVVSVRVLDASQGGWRRHLEHLLSVRPSVCLLLQRIAGFEPRTSGPCRRSGGPS